MIHVIATLEIAPGRRDEFLRAFATLVPTVRQEKGCIEYGPAVELATTIEAQAAVRDHVVTVIEQWESVAALEAHLVAAHMLEFRESTQGLVTGVEIRILEPA